MQYLDKKVAVITGAAGSIGRASVAAFKREGATVVAVDVQGESPDADLFLNADLTNEQQVEELYNRVAQQFGRIDVLFNNAGIALPEDGSILDTDVTVFNRLLEVNTLSVFLCCKHGLPHLIRGGGSVINTASLVASMGSAVSQIGYTASKGAVLSLTREIAVEFAKKGIRVNAISPGPVETPLLTTLFSPEQKQRRLVHVPYGRFAQPREIAEAAVFLASDASSYINGTEFKVDGGISAAYVTPEGDPMLAP
ncbi:SDR family oxidoreductase (plasmid) [Mycobacterium sp. TJFP1]